MEDALAMFSVVPDQLWDASMAMQQCSDRLDVARGDVSVTLPSTAFGRLPEAAALAAALQHSVRCSTGDLDGAFDTAINLGSGLGEGARSYAELDAHCADEYGILA